MNTVTFKTIARIYLRAIVACDILRIEQLKKERRL